MQKLTYKNKTGIISTIVLIVIALIILGYFHISFKSIWNAPLVQDNLKYAWNIFMGGLSMFVDWLKAHIGDIISFFRNLFQK